MNSINRRVFIGVQGGVTNLIKSVTRQVLAGRPSHMVGQPPSPASTDFQLQIPYYHLLESMLVKSIHERLKSGAGRPGILADRPSSGPTASSRQVHSRGDTYFGGILIFLVIS
jgi:hypothetical protein